MITPTILFWLLAALLTGVVAALEGGATRRHPRLLFSSIGVLLFALFAEYTAAPYAVDPTQWTMIADGAGGPGKPNAIITVKPIELVLPKPCVHCPDLALVRTGSVSAPNADRIAFAISKPFGISRSPVTVAEFATFVSKTGYRPKSGCVVGSSFDPAAQWRAPGYPQRPDQPVTCVSFLDAKAYTAWLSEISGATYRLPSDNEWEFAVRQGEFRPLAVSAETAATGQFGVSTSSPPVSADMYRNVADLTSDCWTTEPRNLSADERPVRLFGDCSYRPARGGSWASPVGATALSARVMVGESTGTNWLGFRVVGELKPVDYRSAAVEGSSNPSRPQASQ
jgi:hypothetical protein